MMRYAESGPDREKIKSSNLILKHWHHIVFLGWRNFYSKYLQILIKIILFCFLHCENKALHLADITEMPDRGHLILTRSTLPTTSNQKYDEITRVENWYMKYYDKWLHNIVCVFNKKLFYFTTYFFFIAGNFFFHFRQLLFRQFCCTSSVSQVKPVNPCSPRGGGSRILSRIYILLKITKS